MYWNMKESARSIEVTHSPFQIDFLIDSAVSILKVGTCKWVFNILKSITGLHLFMGFGTRNSLL